MFVGFMVALLVRGGYVPINVMPDYPQPGNYRGLSGRFKKKLMSRGSGTCFHLIFPYIVVFFRCNGASLRGNGRNT